MKQMPANKDPSTDPEKSTPAPESENWEGNSTNPWKIIESDTRYDNAWIRVEHHDVINPAGNPGIYGTVHFKNTAIGILPLDSELNTWLVGQYRFPLNLYSWEIPEGGGEPGTSVLDSAQRELREETGITAARWDKILELHMSNSVSDEFAVVYLARDLELGTAEPEDTEDLMVRKVPFQTALDLAMEGKITDALAVAAILKTARLIDKGEL